MPYLAPKTRASSLSIGGVDYTSSLIELTVSDKGAFKSGIMVTEGQLVLGQIPGGPEIEDYDRNLFKRGTTVILDITNPSTGVSERHPRGYLYIVAVSYDVESETLLVDVGCRLALAYLTDNPVNVLPIIPIPLDPSQLTLENCSASFASAGRVLYQDNQGNFQSHEFFSGDGYGSVAAGEWVSVLGQTTLSVSPLAGTKPVPDIIKLSYSVPVIINPEDELAEEDNTGRVDKVVETSNYFINYPATVWKRNADPQPSGEAVIPTVVTPAPTSPSSTTACGNSPDQPSATGLGTETVSYYLCNDYWTTDRATEYLPATRIATSESTYGAPGAQLSYVVQEVTGPEVEANPSYFADKYAFCVSVYGDVCNPSGACPYYGMQNYLLSRTETFYEYGSANELVRTIQDTYETLLSAARSEDYRQGIVDGVPQLWNNSLSARNGLYRRSRVVTENWTEGNAKVQLTTSYNSITSRGVGIYSGESIDALDGIITSVKRMSTSSTALDVRPDSLNTPQTTTKEEDVELFLEKPVADAGAYTSSPIEAGPYVLEESIPSPLLSTSSTDIFSWVQSYSNYLARFVKGDSYGLQIAEVLRPEIMNNWRPGMPFRYADTANNRILAMRMDSCTWGVTQEEAIVVTDGIWIGFDSGTLDVGSNVVGNSTPNMDRNNPDNPPTPPSDPDGPPGIIDSEVSENVFIVVNVDLWLDSSVFTYFEGGVTPPNPTDLDAKVETTIVPYVSGFVMAAGTLLAVDATGSIPLDYNGSIVATTATQGDVIDADLFA